ncbi:hypothetical protein AA0229_1063 [Gluconobacter cerinus NRIC 0229]|nr:hypothetical protein AA0229_1063 [Gluconobacter cerinus NRIC 0229]
MVVYDGLKLILGNFFRRPHPTQNSKSFVCASFEREPPWAVRQKTHSDKENQCRQHADAKHDPPAAVPEKIACQEGNRDTRNNRKLEANNQASTPVGWRNFCNVDRDNLGCRTNRKPQNQTRHNENRNPLSSRCKRGATKKQGGSKHDRPAAAKPV